MSGPHAHNSNRDVRGLTFAELLVVLTILSILSVIALQSLQPVANQARYEGTKTTIKRIEEAVMGPDGLRQTDGTPILSGFVSDIGRLPLVAPEAQPGWELQELWNPDVWVAFPYGVRHGPPLFDELDFSHIRIACGWRGPYLQPQSTDGLRDGWGKPLVHDWAVDTSAASVNGHSALTIAADLSLEMPTTLEPPRLMSLVSLVGSVNYADGTPAVSDASDNVTVDVYLIYPDAADTSGVLAVADFVVTDEAPDFVFTSVPPGLRAIRAVVRRGASELIADKTVYRHVLRSGLSDVRIQLDVDPPEPTPDPDPPETEN